MATGNGEVQRIPPERKPVSEFPTPSHAVAFYTELVVRTDPAYKANAPVKRGSRYSTMVGAKREVIATYPDLFFLQETKYGNDDQRVLWHWATDENAHDTYNADVTYVANAVTYPAFTRVYTIRREIYESQPTLNIGSPLPGIISVEITSPGQNHTSARGVIDGTSVAIDFVVDSNGSLISAVITNTGEELITDFTAITIIGDGQDSSAVARTQPVGCVLTAQKKEELPQDDPTQHELVRVTRVYETLPGPWIYSTRIDLDGMLVTTKTRRQVADFIVDEDELLPNGIGADWIQTWHKGTDNFVAEEVVETRPVPGDNIVSSRVEEDGMVTTIVKTLVDATTVTSGETLVGGIWTKIRKEEVNSTTFVKNDSPGSVKVCWQIVEARSIPGNPMVDIKIDKDGVPRDIVKTLKDTSLIVQGEIISDGNVWITTEKEAVSDLVAMEVVTARQLPGNFVPSANIGGDLQVATINTRLRPESSISPSSSEAGGFITTVEKKEVTDLVSDEVRTVKRFTDEASYSVSIENLIPREFRAFIPTIVESHILSGTASMPTLGLGEFEHSQKQINKLLYENRTTTLGDISLPITHTNQETTELYGGGILNVNYTLDVLGNQSIDEGYLVTTSTLLDLGNGMVLKETRILDDSQWPSLIGTEVDPTFGVVSDITQQTVPAGTEGGVVGTTYTEVEPTDIWRSKQTIREVNTDALANYVLIFPGTMNLNSKLPDVLTNLQTVFEVNSGNGSYSETGGGFAIQGSISIPLQGEGSASSSVVADATFDLVPPFFPAANTIRAIFLLPIPVSRSDVLDRLAILMGSPVSDWAVFDPEPVTVTCISRQNRVTTRAHVHIQAGAHGGGDCGDCLSSESAGTIGTGTSIDTGITIKTIRIPQCLHGTINIDESREQEATAQATAGWPGFLADTGVITFSTIANVNCVADATTFQEYPTSGLFLVDCQAQPYKYGYAMIHAEVIDFANL